MSRNRALVPLLTDLCLVLIVLFARIVTAGRYLHKWDSVQFALALSDYDITRHQPHPPGYPGYIALGWIARRFTQDDNAALVVVGAVSAAILVVVLHRFGRALLGGRGGLAAGLLAALNPLLWYYSSIALSYMLGVAVATIAVWAAFTVRGRARWIAPFVAGLASVCWMPAGILVLPVCIWCFFRKEPVGSSEEQEDSRTEPHPVGLYIAGFATLFILPILVGYLPAIVDTGGLAQYLEAIRSESGKHVLRFNQWVSAPLSEFIANTGSIADFFKQGLGMGRWLLLVLLIPVTGEIGCKPRRVLGLLPLAIVGFIALHWGAEPTVRSLGIVACSVSIGFLLPIPTTPEGWSRRRLLTWWLGPGLLLFAIVYVNYIGIFVIFLPPLILMEAWGIEKAATFMGLQTAREPSEIPRSSVENGEKIVARGPDTRVEMLVGVLFIVLMLFHQWGVFFAGSESEIQENWRGIVARDTYIESVVSAIEDSGVPMEDLVVLGGTDDYRHWTYYLPESRTIWSKYLLYYPVTEGTTVWVSRDRHQDMLQPEISGDPSSANGLTAMFALNGAGGLVVFPDEWERFVGSGIVTPLGVEESAEDPLCYLVSARGASWIVFRNGVFWLE